MAGSPANYCDVGKIAQLDLTDLAGTFYINLIVFVLLLALFERTRGKRSVYFCRHERLRHRVPPELPRGVLRWVWPLVTMPQEKILAYAGLDAYMLLRYIRFCRRVCVYSGVIGVIVLVPLYLHGDPNLRPDTTYVWRHPMAISLQNLRSQPKLFWVPVLLAYLITFLVLYLLKVEYKRFLQLRLYYLALGDVDMHPQKPFSVMVDRIPFEFRSNAALFCLFDELFPGQVHSAVVSLRIEELEELIQRRLCVLDRLERAMARQTVSGDVPTHWVPKDGSWLSYFLCRGQRVNSIEYYEQWLARLNTTIQSNQEALKKGTDALDKEEEKRHEGHSVLHDNGNNGLTWRATRRVVSEFLIGDPETRASLLEQEYLTGIREAAGGMGTNNHDNHVLGGIEGPGQPTAEAGISINSPTHSGDAEGRSTCSKVLACLQGWTAGIFRVGVRTGQVAISGARQVTKAVGLLTLGSSMSSTGFVTFKSLTCAAVSAQLQLTNQPFTFKIIPAPEPRDIIWANVGVPTTQVETRVLGTSCLFAFLSLFWSLVFTGLYKVQSVLNTLQQEIFKDHPPSRGLETIINVAIEYVPTLLLLIILQLLPLLFWHASYRYERLRTHSDIHTSVFSRYFYFQMLNIYVTIVGGIFLSEITVILRNPRSIITILGCQLPVVAIYFMQVMLTKTFSAVMWEFARVWPLLQMWFFQYCCTASKRTPRQRRTGLYAPPAALYGWIYPSLLLVFTLCLTYAIIMPVTLVLGAVYFVFVGIMYTWHLLYVYVPEYESGGKLFYPVFTRTLVALLLSHITLIGYCVVLEATVVVPFLIPLPLIILPFYWHCENGYYEASARLSLLAARRIDDELKDGDSLPPSSDTRGGGGEGESKGTERVTTPTSTGGTRIIDYFEISAYGQPSLAEPPQAPEKFVWPPEDGEDRTFVADPPRRGRSRSRAFPSTLQEPLTPTPSPVVERNGIDGTNNLDPASSDASSV